MFLLFISFLAFRDNFIFMAISCVCMSVFFVGFYVRTLEWTWNKPFFSTNLIDILAKTQSFLYLSVLQPFFFRWISLVWHRQNRKMHFKLPRSQSTTNNNYLWIVIWIYSWCFPCWFLLWWDDSSKYVDALSKSKRKYVS